jgi:hypothetical protein
MASNKTVMLGAPLLRQLPIPKAMESLLRPVRHLEIIPRRAATTAAVLRLMARAKTVSPAQALRITALLEVTVPVEALQLVRPSLS